MDFTNLGLNNVLVRHLNQINFTSPTLIQSKSIEPILKGLDLLATAQTGTGKTGAYGIPLVSKLMNESYKGNCLVLVPTRELAVQVQKVLKLFCECAKLNTSLVIGGQSMSRQILSLKSNPRIIVGTPGRVLDHLGGKTLCLKEVDFLVLDEADRMLDMGFSRAIQSIMTHLTHKPQTMLFSATLPDSILNLSKKYLRNQVQVSIGLKNVPVESIDQRNLVVLESQKYKVLKEVLLQSKSTIVFVKTKYQARDLAEGLIRDKYNAVAFHGNLPQNKRNTIMQRFISGKYNVIVATDILSRGLDVPHIEYVINYNLPLAPEDYVHRIGRTARGGAKGVAINLISLKESKLWVAIEEFIKVKDLK